MHTCLSICIHMSHLCEYVCSARGVRLISEEWRKNGSILNLGVNNNEKNSQLSLLGVVMFDKVSETSELVKTEQLLLREIEC